MSHIIDRRINSSDKNLPNRERFKERNKYTIQQAVKKMAAKKSITDTKGGNISIDVDGMSEPSFRRGNEGEYDVVAPGNKKYLVGDNISKRGESPGSGNQGSPTGDGEDGFRFLISEEEYLDLLFSDLALPDMVKKTLVGSDENKLVRAGYTQTGSPANLSIIKTVGKSIQRRVALQRPSDEEVEALRKIIEETIDVDEKLKYEDDLEDLLRRQKRVPFIDNIDVRYRNFSTEKKPKTKALIYAMMDVSASMGETEKDLAKRFFLMLHLFLKRQYNKVEIVFIRHTQDAQVVDEKTFFYDVWTGGTMVSSSIALANELTEKYDPNEWNIYVAHASDGDNCEDPELGEELKKLMENVQYFAYIETSHSRQMYGSMYGMNTAGNTTLWNSYSNFNEGNAKKIAMKKVSAPSDIYPVFRELFSKTVK